MTIRKKSKWIPWIMAVLVVMGLASGCVTPQPCADPIPAPEATAQAEEGATESTPEAETTPDVSQMISYNEADIAAAQLVAEAYYKDNTNFEVESMEHDKTYNEVDEMRFIVTIKDSDNPPRTITLHKNQDGAWEAKEGSEGY